MCRTAVICLFWMFSHGQSLAQPDAVATYVVTFTGTWSALSHPAGFPSGSHFSGLIGATHDESIKFWASGTLSSDGIERMAETGGKSALQSEISNAITARTAEFELSGGGIGTSPGSVSLQFEISKAYPLVTLVSMLAPSPDWFVGVMSMTLLDQGQWISLIEIPLDVYDAGTDNGSNYRSPDNNANPAQPIAKLGEGPFSSNSLVGTMVFRRQTVVGSESELPEQPGIAALYPNPVQSALHVVMDNRLARNGNETSVELTVRDLLGRLIWSRTVPIDVGRSTETIDVSQWPTGQYIMSVREQPGIKPMLFTVIR